MNLFYYLLEANLYLLVFYAFYWALLRKETFYSYNRFYLLGVSLISFVLPGIKLSGLRIPEPEVIYHTEILKETESALTRDNILLFGYLFVAMLFLAHLLIRLYQVFKLIHRGTLIEKDGYKIVEMEDSDLSFSFLNYLFLNPVLEQKETVIRHELVHIRQRHSLDILFFEVLRIINWFNPAIIWMRKDMKYLHEYLADEHTVEHELSASDYAMFLIRNSCGATNHSLGSQVFSSTLLKERIRMLSQDKSGELAVLKFRLLVFLLPLMLCASGLAFTKPYGFIDLMPVDKETRAKVLEIQNRPETLKFPPPVVTPPSKKFPKPTLVHVESPKPDVKIRGNNTADQEPESLPLIVSEQQSDTGFEDPPPPPVQPVNQ